MESGGNFEDYKLAYIRFISCHLFGPVNHGQTRTGWERSGEKDLIISDNQAFSCLIIKTFDNQTVPPLDYHESVIHAKTSRKGLI